MNYIEHLTEKKISQKDIAKGIGEKPQVVNNWFQGKSQPNIEKLIKLANFFNTTIDDIVGRESEIIDLNSFPNYKKDLIKTVIKLTQEQCNQTNCFFKGLVPNICQQLAEETHNKDLENEATIAAIKDAEILNSINNNKGIK